MYNGFAWFAKDKKFHSFKIATELQFVFLSLALRIYCIFDIMLSFPPSKALLNI